MYILYIHIIYIWLYMSFSTVWFDCWGKFQLFENRPLVFSPFGDIIGVEPTNEAVELRENSSMRWHSVGRSGELYYINFSASDTTKEAPEPCDCCAINFFPWPQPTCAGNNIHQNETLLAVQFHDRLTIAAKMF